MSNNAFRILTIVGFAIAGAMATSNHFNAVLAQQQEITADQMDELADRVDSSTEGLSPEEAAKIEETQLPKVEAKVEEHREALNAMHPDDPGYKEQLDKVEAAENFLEATKDRIEKAKE